MSVISATAARPTTIPNGSEMRMGISPGTMIATKSSSDSASETPPITRNLASLTDTRSGEVAW